MDSSRGRGEEGPDGARVASPQWEGGTTDARTQSVHSATLPTAKRPGRPRKGYVPLWPLALRAGADGGTCRRTWACACQEQIAWVQAPGDGGICSRAYPKAGWTAGGFGAGRPGCGCWMEYRPARRYLGQGYVHARREGRTWPLVTSDAWVRVWVPQGDEADGAAIVCDQPGVWSICASAARPQLSAGRPRAVASHCAARRPTAEIRPAAEGQLEERDQGDRSPDGRRIAGTLGGAPTPARRPRWLARQC